MSETYNGRKIINAIEHAAANHRYPGTNAQASPGFMEVYVELEDGTHRCVTATFTGVRNRKPILILYAGVPVENEQEENV